MEASASYNNVTLRAAPSQVQKEHRELQGSERDKKYIRYSRERRRTAKIPAKQKQQRFSGAEAFPWHFRRIFGCVFCMTKGSSPATFPLVKLLTFE